MTQTHTTHNESIFNQIWGITSTIVTFKFNSMISAYARDGLLGEAMDI